MVKQIFIADAGKTVWLVDVMILLLLDDFGYHDETVVGIEGGIDESRHPLQALAFEDIGADEAPCGVVDQAPCTIMLVAAFLHLVVGVLIGLVQAFADAVVGQMDECQFLTFFGKMFCPM